MAVVGNWKMPDTCTSSASVGCGGGGGPFTIGGLGVGGAFTIGGLGVGGAFTIGSLRVGGPFTIGGLGVGRLTLGAGAGGAAGVVAAGVPAGGSSATVIVIFGCRGKGAKGSLSLGPRLIFARFWSGSVAGINGTTLMVAGCLGLLKAGGWAAGGLGEGVGVSWVIGGD